MALNGACRVHIASKLVSRVPLSAFVRQLRSSPLRATSKADNTSPSVEQTSTSARTTGMKLNGSCHCGTVKFEVESRTPQPFMHCYCTICRKTQGGGGYTINIMVITKRTCMWLMHQTCMLTLIKVPQKLHVGMFRKSIVHDCRAYQKHFLPPAQRMSAFTELP